MPGIDDDDDEFYREISNDDLRAEHVPGEDAGWYEICQFAFSFDGFRYWGSFDACADVANKFLDGSLVELRTCLFFEQRRWRHYDEIPMGDDMEYIRGILRKIVQLVPNQDAPVSPTSPGEDRPKRSCRFAPWIGPKFDDQPLAGVRILVLGESHYAKSERTLADSQHEPIELTRNVVRRLALGPRPHRFFTTVARLLSHLEQADRAATADLWNRIAFYNYIQDIVGSGPRMRPTKEMWADAHLPFCDVLDELRPDCVLVLGKALRHHLTRAPRQRLHLLSAPDRWRRLDFSSVWFASIPHPSSFGFRLSAWRPTVQGLITETQGYKAADFVPSPK